MLFELSLEILIFIITFFVGLLLLVKNLSMPEQYYKNKEIFDTKLRERISLTPDYFNIVKEPEPGDIQAESEKEFNT